jgi:hypothetical protein
MRILAGAEEALGIDPLSSKQRGELYPVLFACNDLHGARGRTAQHRQHGEQDVHK